MKSIACLLMAIIVLMSLTTCNYTGISSSDSASISSEPEPAPVTLDVEAEVHRQIGEIQNAVKDLAPTAGIGEFDWDDALAERAKNAIASLGYPVQMYQKDMPNYERVTDFLDKAKAGENAFVAVYSVRAFGGMLSVDGYVFEKDENGFSKRYITVGGEEELSEQYPQKDIVLTEHGNLIAYEADEGGDPASGFRVLPLPGEYRDAYEKYVRLVDVQSDGVINQAWSEEYGFQNLSWEFVFEEIWERENDAVLIDKGNPWYTETATNYGSDNIAAVPADVVEGTLQKYFNVQTETLRKITAPFLEGDEAVLYNPEDNTYRIWGFRGGGYKPTVEVWGITDNADGTVSLELAWVSLDFGKDGTVYSVLTVMPEQDGGYKYISNIFSEDTVRAKVESALALAKSAEIVYQGGLTTTGESVVEHGYHFAAVDIDKLHQSGMKLGGLSSTDSIKMWFHVIYEKETAEKYTRQIFDTPLYIDAMKDGEQTLFVNLDANGSPIAQGEWMMDDFAVVENTPNRIMVQMSFDTADGKKTRALTLVPGERRSWVLTDSYEGLWG